MLDLPLRRAPRDAFTIVEMLIALIMTLAVFSLCWGLVHHVIAPMSRYGLTGMTRRSMLRKDLLIGLEKIRVRLGEATEIRLPAPGTSGDVLEFRDVARTLVRLRVDEASRSLVSERWDSSRFIPERAPTRPGGVPVGWPVRVDRCTRARFTSAAPLAVGLLLTVSDSVSSESASAVIEVGNGLYSW